MKIFAGVALSAIGAGISVAQPIAMMQIINAALQGGGFATPLSVLGALLLSDVVVSGVQSWVLLRAGEHVVLDVRKRLVGNILFWRLSSYRRFRRGDLIARVGNDASNLRSILSDGTIEATGAVLTLLGAIVLMVIIDPVLFSTSLAIFAVAGIISWTFLSKITKEAEEANQYVGALSADLDRVLGGFITVITSGMQSKERDRLVTRAEQSWRAGLRAATWDAMTTPVLLFGANLALLVVFGLGGVRVASGALGLPEFVSFVLYFGVLIPPVIVGFQAMTTIQRGLGSLHRINEVLDEPAAADAVEDDSGPNPAFTRARPAKVAAQNISFSYPGSEHPVLKDLSMEATPGGITAILGSSGSGKTTLLHILCGLEDPEAGEVRIDGAVLNPASVKETNSFTAFVQQEAPIFWGTIRENLTYGVHHIPHEDDLIDVVSLLGLSETISRLPNGLDSHVDDHGVSLSGGERQRISIARALLRRPRMLILDEPTAQVDAANEARLISALKKLSSQMTVILSTHRSTLADAADQTINMEGD
ncbi:ABC transporter ATP-binding protein [Xylanimonas ulmi]|uniref:ABC transporter ATP-binding protein n=1 Tax=Xylanimonas ulmi TaxID=228973 RepID=UPI0013EEE7E0|nr:ABC transporter ATP-binding protein [Xylanibacterium ulmi]